MRYDWILTLIMTDLYVAGWQRQAVGSSWSVGALLWSRVKYLNNDWLDCHEIHSPQRISSIHFGDPPNLPLVPPVGSCLCFLVRYLASSGWIVM